MEEFFDFSSFQWKFLGLNFQNCKWKVLQYLLFLVHIIQIIIYGFTRVYPKFTDHIKIDDLISGTQVIIFSGIILVKYVAIFRNQSEISKIIQRMPQKINTDEKLRFRFQRLIREGLHAYHIYGRIIAFFATVYLIYMQFNLNYKIVGGLWCPPGSDLTKRLFYNWMIVVNLAVLTVWITCEILKYGLISLTIVEYQRIQESFVKFVAELKIKIRKKKMPKKVRFSRIVEFEGKKVKMRHFREANRNVESQSLIGSLNLDMNVGAQLRIIQAPLFNILMPEDDCFQSTKDF